MNATATETADRVRTSYSAAIKGAQDGAVRKVVEIFGGESPAF
jgi:hypothetical protein